MLTITKNQARQRFKSLPENLQDILFAESTAEAVNDICEENKVPENQISSVASAAGLVVMGFLKLNALSKEIQERTGLSDDIAKRITSSLENRFLNSVRPDLEKVYAPLVGEVAPPLGPTKAPAPAIPQNIPAAGPPKPPPISLDGLARSAAPLSPRPAISSAPPTPPLPPPSKTVGGQVPVMLHREPEVRPVAPPASRLEFPYRAPLRTGQEFYAAGQGRPLFPIPFGRAGGDCFGAGRASDCPGSADQSAAHADSERSAAPAFDTGSGGRHESSVAYAANRATGAGSTQAACSSDSFPRRESVFAAFSICRPASFSRQASLRSARRDRFKPVPEIGVRC